MGQGEASETRSVLVDALQSDAREMQSLILDGSYLAAWGVAFAPDPIVPDAGRSDLICYRVAFALTVIQETRGVDAIWRWIRSGESILGGWRFDDWLESRTPNQLRKAAGGVVKEIRDSQDEREYVKNPFVYGLQYEGMWVRSAFGMIWIWEMLMKDKSFTTPLTDRPSGEARWASWVSRLERSVVLAEERDRRDLETQQRMRQLAFENEERAAGRGEQGRS
jgi:hypothetical protein